MDVLGVHSLVAVPEGHLGIVSRQAVEFHFCGDENLVFGRDGVGGLERQNAGVNGGIAAAHDDRADGGVLEAQLLGERFDRRGRIVPAVAYQDHPRQVQTGQVCRHLFEGGGDVCLQRLAQEGGRLPGRNRFLGRGRRCVRGRGRLARRSRPSIRLAVHLRGL